MKILIAGSRSIHSYDVKQHINEYATLIICGGAPGIDALAEEAADELGISKLVLRPQYKIYGKVAPIVRNKQMVEIADEVVIIWDGKSRGTLYTLRYAEKMRKKVFLYDISQR